LNEYNADLGSNRIMNNNVARSRSVRHGHLI